MAIPVPEKPARNIALYALWLLVAVAVVMAIIKTNEAGSQLDHAWADGIDEHDLAHARYQQYLWTLASVLLAGIALGVSAIRHRDYPDD